MRIQEEVNLKDEETRKLQEEVADARRRQEEAAAALLDATTPQHLNVHEDDHEENDDMVNGEFGKTGTYFLSSLSFLSAEILILLKFLFL